MEASAAGAGKAANNAVKARRMAGAEEEAGFMISPNYKEFVPAFERLQ
jgi:hypothetical protein